VNMMLLSALKSSIGMLDLFADLERLEPEIERVRHEVQGLAGFCRAFERPEATQLAAAAAAADGKDVKFPVRNAEGLRPDLSITMCRNHARERHRTNASNRGLTPFLPLAVPYRRCGFPR